MPYYRKPTPAQERAMEQSRKLMQEGIEGEKDILTRISPVAAKQTRDAFKRAERLRESVPESVRDYEAYQSAGYKKGGKIMSKRAKRFDDGGDVEAQEMPRSTYERVGKSALEEGEEIFQKELAKRQEKTSTSPRRRVVDYGDETQRLMSRRGPAVAAQRNDTVPGEVARPGDYPIPEGPSALERGLNALPPVIPGVALGAMAGRAMAARRLAQNIAASKAAARGRSTDALMQSVARRSTARSAAKEAEAAKDAARMAEEGGMRYGRGAPQPAKQDYRQAEAFIGRRSPGDGYKKGGNVKTYAKGGTVSASRRADGIAQRGKTKGRIC